MSDPTDSALNAPDALFIFFCTYCVRSNRDLDDVVVLVTRAHAIPNSPTVARSPTKVCWNRPLRGESRFNHTPICILSALCCWQKMHWAFCLLLGTTTKELIFYWGEVRAVMLNHYQPPRLSCAGPQQDVWMLREISGNL